MTHKWWKNQQLLEQKKSCFLILFLSSSQMLPSDDVVYSTINTNFRSSVRNTNVTDKNLHFSALDTSWTKLLLNFGNPVFSIEFFVLYIIGMSKRESRISKKGTRKSHSGFLSRNEYKFEIPLNKCFFFCVIIIHNIIHVLNMHKIQKLPEELLMTESGVKVITSSKNIFF